MSTDPRIYSGFVGFRVTDDLNFRLQRFSAELGRKKSDVIRYLLGRCLNAYETDKDAISKIKQDLY